MPTTQLFNKITLREHPDLSPVADSSFEKGHSFIFPEDELVFCAKFIAPDDIGGTFNTVVLNSIKCSVIAKKPNIFTEQFARQFNATRSFELDSFSTTFNGTNAPNIPWGTDGYAPNINLTQDRNFQMPAGDFKRQIKLFTTHTPSTSKWEWNFWFPVIFREEYWLSLAAADSDFYDITQPQNGKNQKWLRYHDLSALPFGWKIFTRFELKYSVGGIQNTIYSEYNLSNEQVGIQDYDSNTDYALKSIKTCAVGGTPINTPYPPIFANKNTSCFGYFDKQTAWDTGEKDNITALFRIRPSTNGDTSSWNRASSKYPVQPTDVWLPVNQILGTGSDVTGTIITFDSMDDKKITVESQIDYQKLLSKYPTYQNFTLYCRLYNSTLYTE